MPSIKLQITVTHLGYVASDEDNEKFRAAVERALCAAYPEADVKVSFCVEIHHLVTAEGFGSPEGDDGAEKTALHLVEKVFNEGGW